MKYWQISRKAITWLMVFAGVIITSMKPWTGITILLAAFIIYDTTPQWITIGRLIAEKPDNTPSATGED